MTGWLLLAAACVVLVLRCAARQQHGFRAVLGRAICGVAAIALLRLLEPLTGTALALNRFTAFVAAVLGLPGVIGLLLLQLIL